VLFRSVSERAGRSMFNSLLVYDERGQRAVHRRKLVPTHGERLVWRPGDAADLVWGLTGLVGYRLNDRATLGLGYRYYDIDFSNDRVDADVQFYGPIAGLAFHF